MKRLLTIAGLMSCTVPEFDPTTYKGLRSGIGAERKSSRHYKCKKACCIKTEIVNKLKRGVM